MIEVKLRVNDFSISSKWINKWFKNKLFYRLQSQAETDYNEFIQKANTEEKQTKNFTGNIKRGKESRNVIVSFVPRF